MFFILNSSGSAIYRYLKDDPGFCAQAIGVAELPWENFAILINSWLFNIFTGL